MSDYEKPPIQVSLGEGELPIDVAWEKALDLPVEKFREVEKISPEIDIGIDTVNLEFAFTQPQLAGALMEHHFEQYIDLKRFRDTTKRNLIIQGLDAEPAEYIANLVCIGVVAGREEEVFVRNYSAQGIREIEKPG